MNSNSENSNEKPAFEPLLIMGYFWFAFGIIVLIASFFVEETPQVPHIRGVLTNIFAGSLLFLIGLFSILKGRKKNSAQK